MPSSPEHAWLDVAVTGLWCGAVATTCLGGMPALAGGVWCLRQCVMDAPKRVSFRVERIWGARQRCVDEDGLIGGLQVDRS